MGLIASAIAQAIESISPEYELIEGEVVSWRPETALVRTKDGYISASNPLGSKADKAKVLIARPRNKRSRASSPFSNAAIVGVLTKEVARAR